MSALSAFRLGIATAVLLVMAACGGTTESGDASRNPDQPPKSPTDIAIRTVADTLGMPVTDIRVISSESRTFGDASLDCPEPGMAYPQVVTPGYQIIVEGDGRRFDVRVAGQSGRICHRRGPSRPAAAAAPAPSSGSLTQQLISETRADLATRLELDPASIHVLDIAVWRPGDVLPGCSAECPDAATGCGYRIGLTAGGRRYTYHATADSVTPCPDLATR